ncbi:monovalent cation/H+ antiporter subunit D family protein [Corynebacterium terpenotabidum]|uniref:Putative monovalent cation/H+ antiporter subunit D n=1 Tax=Corynebacterium terpenotabidum Y-11 TaxID=1200352 RepID=S4XJ19_9CORY|nr:monovalent cation/H+ antiporter subunit D family protein [Corynebacterium terpenotabidum]AGP31750.1 putative monovalent cation/H+ antiporter subunit D [Corynebacterium terpenotabidum Y-11]
MSFSGDLLPVFVFVPLISAAVAALLPWSTARRVLGLAVPAAGIVGGALLLATVSGAGSDGDAGTEVIATGIGKFAGGVAIPLAADTLSALMITTTAIVALAATWFAEVVGENRARFFPAMTLMLLGGVWGALLTADIFNLFVFIEIMLMPSFGLLTMTGSWARLAAGRNFILVNLVTSMALLSGVGLVYGVIGTTNLAALAGAAGPRAEIAGFDDGVFGTRWQLWLALGMVLIALCVKAGAAPVHTWLPRSYGSTSPTVMALFSGLHTKVGVYAVLRIYMTVFDGDQRWAMVILGFAVLGMLIGGFAGLGETTLRGVVAYQMVNGIPFILVSLAFLSGDAGLMLSAAVFYMLHHMISAAAMILSAGAIEETYGTGRLRRLSGLMRHEPLISTVFAASALSLAGLPPFSGLWGKLMLVSGMTVDHGWKVWIGTGAVVIASVGALLSLLYAWRKVFWGRPMDPQDMDPTLAVSGSMTWPSATLMVLSVVMFLAAGPVTGWTRDAAAGLTDTTAYVEAVLGDPDEAVGVVLPTEVLMTPYDPSDPTQGGDR